MKNTELYSCQRNHQGLPIRHEYPHPTIQESRKNRRLLVVTGEIRPPEKTSLKEAGCPKSSDSFSPMELASGFFWSRVDGLKLAKLSPRAGSALFRAKGCFGA